MWAITVTAFCCGHTTLARGAFASASWAAGRVAACRADGPEAQAIAALSVWGAERLHGRTNVRQVYMRGHLMALGALAPPCSRDDGHGRLDALDYVARLPLNIDAPEHCTRVPPVACNHGRHFHSTEGADFEQGDPCCLPIRFPRRRCCAAGSSASPAGPWGVRAPHLGRSGSRSESFSRTRRGRTGR